MGAAQLEGLGTGRPWVCSQVLAGAVRSEGLRLPFQDGSLGRLTQQGCPRGLAPRQPASRGAGSPKEGARQTAPCPF